MPPPVDVARRRAASCSQSPSWRATWAAACGASFAGFLAAAVTGVGLGLVIGRFAPCDDVLLPPLEVLRPIPAVAWIPLAILMFPSSELSMIFITFIGALFPILLNTIHGVEGVDRRLVASARSLGTRAARACSREVIAAGGRAQHRHRPGDRHGHLLVLPGHGRDDLGPVRHRLLHLGVLHACRTTPDIVVGMLVIGVLGMGSSALMTPVGAARDALARPAGERR